MTQPWGKPVPAASARTNLGAGIKDLFRIIARRVFKDTSYMGS